MGGDRRLWTLLGCLLATVALLTVAVLPSHSSAGYLGATMHTGRGVACGSIGHDPTKAEVEQFAAQFHDSPSETSKLLHCFGFTASR